MLRSPQTLEPVSPSADGDSASSQSAGQLASEPSSVEPTSAEPTSAEPTSAEPSSAEWLEGWTAANELFSLGLHQLVERQAAQTPEAIAVIHQNSRLTYRELNQQANQLAHYLIQQGVVAEQLIAISLVRSPNMLVAFLGVLKAGAAYVPIDPDYPDSRRQYILRDANAQIVLTESSLLSEFESGSANVIQLDADANLLAKQPTHNPELIVQPKQLAYVIYTSGSTGNPKGVMAHHRGLVNYTLALIEALALTASDRMLQFSTMSFDFIVSEVYPTLASGGSLALRTDEIARSTQAFVDFITRYEVTVIQFTTAFWHELVNGLERLDLTLPPSLRLVLFGGEKASLTLCRQWLRTIGDYPRLFNAYGPTEATVITTLYDAIAEGYDGSDDLPIGRAIRNAKTYVLDADLQPVQPGEAGELCIGGPGVTHGYMNLPEKTAKAFCDDPFIPGERLYRTGDRVKMDKTGLIRFIGRVDFQVKIRGYRIELGEIETCLDQYPHVQSRIVIAREDTPGDKRLVAYVSMKPGYELDREDLRRFMQEKLPKFMVPAAVVVLDALPKNANGKIDRNALPMPNRAAAKQTIVAPRSPLETQLAAVWCSVLGLDALGVTDNFFELGGNSLLVMRLFAELEAVFDCRMPPTEIFTAPTVAQLAQRMAANCSSISDSFSSDSFSSDSSEQAALPRSHPQSAPASASAEKSTGSSSTLLPLRLGSSGSALFLVHDAEGETGLYLHLARQMQSDRAVYAIGPCTAPDAPLAYSQIAQIANDYVQQIRQVQPSGPYWLSGLCAGGVIAFEIAVQLEAMGEEVTLGLMDAPAPGARKKVGRVSRDRIARLGKALEEKKVTRDAAGQAFPLPLEKIWKKGTNVLRYEVFSKGAKAVASAKARSLGFFQARGWPIPVFIQGLSMRELLVFAYEHYRPGRKFTGSVWLLRATSGNGTHGDRPYVEEYADPLLGWGDFCERAIAVKDVPGGHSTMLNAKNAPTLAKALEEISLP